MEINIEKLIHFVRAHGVLYDTSNKEYYDRIKKKRAWEDVCSKLNDNWDTWDDSEQSVYHKEVQKKWQSLRDCFRRELILQKTPQSGKKKAKYKYFDVLSFLSPFTQNLNVECSAQEDGTFFKELETSSNFKDPLSEDHVPARKRKLSSTYIEEVPILNDMVQETSRARFLDDDEAFLFSLLPSFKEYNQDQKYMLRIELMKTILRFKQTQRDLRTVKVEVEDDDEDCAY